MQFALHHKKSRIVKSWLCCLLVSIVLSGCQPASNTADTPKDFSDRQINIVATTSMIADLVSTIGGDQVNVEGLMGPGVDPHLYKASEGDVIRMAQADIVFYNGLHLEGKMTEVFEQMSRRGIPTIAVAEQAVPDSFRLMSMTYAGNFDPHVWFDVKLWQRVANHTAQVLADMDPSQAEYYEAKATTYLKEMEELDTYVRAKAALIPETQRVLITSHDAFGYFGRAYGFEVHALQGLSTATEAGTADVQNLAEFVATRRIPAMFVESSVSPRGIEAVKAAVESRNYNVEIGGYLFSDALGNPDSPEGTYIGTVRYNINTVTNALTGKTTAAQ